MTTKSTKKGVIGSLKELNNYCRKFGKSVIVGKDKKTGLTIIRGFKGEHLAKPKKKRKKKKNFQYVDLKRAFK